MEISEILDRHDNDIRFFGMDVPFLEKIVPLKDHETFLVLGEVALLFDLRDGKLGLYEDLILGYSEEFSLELFRIVNEIPERQREGRQFSYSLQDILALEREIEGRGPVEFSFFESPEIFLEKVRSNLEELSSVPA